MVKTLNKEHIHCCPDLDEQIEIPKRVEVLEILESLREHIAGNFLFKEQFVELLGEFIGNIFKVDVTHAETPEVESNDVDFNGFYDSGLDENGDPSVEIYIVTNPHDNFIILDNESFDTIMRRLADSIIHELIHMKQSRARDWLEVENMAYAQVEDEIEEAQLYLSAYDEIDAYAYNIACELLEKCDLATSLKKLEKATAIQINDSQNLWAYVNTFGKEVDHPVLKRLIKRVYKTLYKLGK